MKLALDPPTTELTILTDGMLDDACAHARESPRKRVIVPFHRSDSEILQRMLNAVQPRSYVRPHRHLEPPKPEAWVLLRGELLFFTFDDDGGVRDRLLLRAGGPQFGVDLMPGVYHSFIALAPDTVIYEVKSGPYDASNDKSFAPWAPAENTPEAAVYLDALLREQLPLARR